jgi:sulfur relay (sulfurtransferase) complex TusBCD TusD component (DsrE family)
MIILHCFAPLLFLLQADVVVGKREKARLKELQKKKKEKIQEILDTQNAAIDADMVCTIFRGIHVYKSMVCMR